MGVSERIRSGMACARRSLKCGSSLFVVSILLLLCVPMVLLQMNLAQSMLAGSSSSTIKWPKIRLFRRKENRGRWTIFPPPPTQANVKPMPLQLMELYMQQHNQEVVLQQPQGRRYVHASYTCPRQAGNLLHDFLDNVALAMLTNRTLLWSYRDQTQWDAENSYENCHTILQRHPWMASHDVVNQSVFRGSIPATQVMDGQVTANRTQDQRQHVVIVQTRKWGLSQKRDGWHGRLQLQDTKAAQLMKAAYHTELTQQRIDDLYVEGHDFFYGMLYRHTLSLRPQWLYNTTETTNDTKPSSSSAAVFTLGIHSRHVGVGNRGDTLSPNELKCLDTILRERPFWQPCRVYIIADRVETIRAYTNVTQQQYGCQAFAAPHKVSYTDSMAVNMTTTQSQRSYPDNHAHYEHGPWAGVGYFQDLEFAAQHTETAVLVTRRSSSALLTELIAYDRRIRAWNRGQDHIAELIRCYR